MKGKTFLLLLTVLLFAFLSQAVLNEGINQKNTTEVTDLRQIAAGSGNVRVIVKLDVPGIKALTAASNRFCTVTPGKEAQWGGAHADMELKQASTRTAERGVNGVG